MSATDDQYDRVRELFSGVCDLSPGARAAILDRECGTDRALRDEVEALLELRDAGPTTTLKLPPDERSIPRTIGRYRVIREIGRGAMGIVYLGIPLDDQFRHPVAIKVLQRGMDTAEILRRFDLEWHLMAALNHPGLVRLFEGGQTDDGLPYFTMEYVEGQPIDDYCDTHRLRIDERLELFSQVCAAVHHAHQNLVIHRDLKPSHILVNQAGVPKVLDFSIAKLITSKTSVLGDLSTAPDVQIMTPEYASPEQVRGNPITTASDIYSLGIILYELVTGHRPYTITGHARSELERVICESEPAKPSTVVTLVQAAGRRRDSGDPAFVTPELVSRVREGRPKKLRRRLAGDVDHITMKALRKEPQRRYQSAAQFAGDIRRHLDNLPVIARRDTARYRCVKFMRRHRVAVAVATVAVIVVAAWGLSVGKLRADEIRQAQRTSAELDRTRRMLGESLDLAHAVIFDLHDEIDHLDGSSAARRRLIASALECLDGIAKDVGSDVELKRALASAYDRVGDIQGGIRNPSAGDIPGALRSYRAGLRLREELREALPEDTQIRALLSVSHMHIGDMRREAGDLGGALASYRRHLELVETGAPSHERLGVMALDNIATVLFLQGDLEAAKQQHERSLARRELRVLAGPDENTRRDFAVGLRRLGEVLAALGDDDAALLKYERALDVWQELVDAEGLSGHHRRDLAWTRSEIAGLLLRLDRAEEAGEHARRCLAIFAERAADNPDSAQARYDLAACRDLQGRVLAATGDASGAMELYRACRLATEQLVGQEPADRRYQVLLAESHEHAARAYAQLGALDDALRSYRRAIDIVRPLVAVDGDLRRKEHLGRIQRAIARVQFDAGDLLGAENALLSARALYEFLYDTQPQHAGCRYGLASTLHDLSRVRAARGYVDEAGTLAERARAVLRGMPGRRAEALRASIG